ncbi:MAG TPA: tetratricopeptide repeat protein [Nitrosomonas sp.]|nr:tetratricopeptide repeat protein [Nitrosomonas sp.]
MFCDFKRLVLFVIILLTLVGCVGVDSKTYYAGYYDQKLFDQRLAASKSTLSQQELLDETKLAEQGNAKAQLLVGLYYLTGSPSPVIADLVKAIYWVRRSAQQGNPDGQRWLGSLYRFGIGVPQDSSQELFWYTKAAESGDHIAQNILGFKYFYGVGVSYDNNRALEFWKKSANSGNVTAKTHLDNYYKQLQEQNNR